LEGAADGPQLGERSLLLYRLPAFGGITAAPDAYRGCTGVLLSGADTTRVDGGRSPLIPEKPGASGPFVSGIASVQPRISESSDKDVPKAQPARGAARRLRSAIKISRPVKVRSGYNRNAGRPLRLPAFLYDIEKGEGKCCWVYQASCLMGPSYKAKKQKSTGGNKPSQIVNNRWDFMGFRSRNVQKDWKIAH